jgi:hypothetical protein
MPDPAIGRTLAIACLALAAVTAGAQTMYKWVDEKGTTHFSENPPPDGKKATKIEPKVTPPSSPATAKDGPEAWRAQEADFRRRQIERGQREQAEGRDKALRAQNCAEARRRLATLQNTHRIYRDNEDGTRSYMTDEQRDAAIARLREAARENCD